MGELKLSSPTFADQGTIPAKYTCDGDNINPPLKIENPPSGCQSLALILEDPDAPSGLWVHWIVWNILPTIGEIAEGSVPREAIAGKNSWQRNAYGGPCPPEKVHHYIFRLYALDTRLDLGGGHGKEDMLEAMEDHILAEATLTGLYGEQ